MAVRPTTPADYPRMVTLWNQQEASLRADGTHTVWTLEACAAFLRYADVHAIDEQTGTFLVFHRAEDGRYEGQGYIGNARGLVRVIRFCAPLFNPADVIYWMLGPSASLTIKTYFTSRYALTTADGRLYYETTAAELGARA